MIQEAQVDLAELSTPEKVVVTSIATAANGALMTGAGLCLQKYELLGAAFDIGKVFLTRMIGNLSISVLSNFGDMVEVENFVRGVEMKIYSIPASEIFIKTGVAVISLSVLVGSVAVLAGVLKDRRNKEIEDTVADE